MSKRRFFNTIKRRILPKLGGKVLVRKVSWEDSFPAKRDPAPQDWAKQLRAIETLGQGLVVMRMS